MTQASAMTIFRGEMEGKMAPQFAAVLPKHIPVERMMRTIATAVSTAQRPNGSNKILEADRGSLWQAAMTACVLGLEPDPATGQGYLVPFKGKVVFVPGYAGLITLAHNSGFTVQGRIVRQADEFDYAYGLEPKLVHKPSQSGARGEQNPIVAAYATAHSNTVPPTFVWMDLPDIIKVRNASSGFQYADKNRKDSPWHTDFEAMARKSPIRALCRNLPLNVQKAAALDAMLDQGTVAYASKTEDGMVDVTPADEQPKDEPGSLLDAAGEDQ